MDELYLLTDKALDELKRSISTEKYKNDEPFIYDQFKGRQYRSSIEKSADLPNLYVKSKNEEELWKQSAKNAIELHKALRNSKVPLRYLVDERFWTYLSHTKYWKFMKERVQDLDEEKIKRNWFFNGGNQTFSRNPLVRLWWRAESSYDEKLDNPYELTEIAFEYADPVNQLVERKIGKSRKVFRCMLIAIRDTENAQKLKSSENRAALGKAINTIAGVKLIEVMTEEELVGMFSEQIKYIVNDKK